MAKTPKSEPIDIPDDARAVKPLFRTRAEADAILPLIREHMERDGRTYTFPFHTHTEPPPGAIPVYIGEFEVPARLAKAGRWSPCPCCWDHFAKFVSGKIAWFPKERVIRLIGPDCFRALNPEAHEAAKRQYDREEQAKKNRAYILSQIPKVGPAVRAVRQALTVAAAVERFHEDLHNALTAVGLVLWVHVRDSGRLKVSVTRTETRRRADGTETTVQVDDEVTKGRLSGYQLLNPTPLTLTARLRSSMERLRPYAEPADWSHEVREMDDVQAAKVSELLYVSTVDANDAITEIAELRRLAEPVSINTLRKWAEQPRCPLRAYFAVHVGRIAVGKHERTSRYVEIPPTLRDPLAAIPFDGPGVRRTSAA